MGDDRDGLIGKTRFGLLASCSDWAAADGGDYSEVSMRASIQRELDGY